MQNNQARGEEGKLSNLTHAKHASKQEREGCSSVKGRQRDQDVDVLGWLEVRGCGSGSGWLRLVLGQRSDRERQSISVFGASDDVIHSRGGCGSAWEVKYNTQPHPHQGKA